MSWGAKRVGTTRAATLRATAHRNGRRSRRTSGSTPDRAISAIRRILCARRRRTLSAPRGRGTSGNSACGSQARDSGRNHEPPERPPVFSNFLWEAHGTLGRRLSRKRPPLLLPKVEPPRAPATQLEPESALLAAMPRAPARIAARAAGRKDRLQGGHEDPSRLVWVWRKTGVPALLCGNGRTAYSLSPYKEE